MAYLRDGVITATLSQNPYAQGHDPAIHLYNYLVAKSEPPMSRLLMPMQIITRENYGQFWSEAQGLLVSEVEAKALAKPVDITQAANFKIAVILPDDTVFWRPVAQGAQAAMETLARRGVQGRAFVPEAFRAGDRSFEAYAAAVRSLLEEGHRGIALPIMHVELVPLLNEAVDNGVAVATFNAEPQSFRGMVGDVARHAQNLLRFSMDLATTAHEASRTTTQVNGSITSISRGTKEQGARLSTTKTAMDSLGSHIDRIAHEAGESSAAAQKTIRAAGVGRERVRDNENASGSLQAVSERATLVIKKLSQDAVKIREIVTFIEDVATQTNVLAINAAIQAAHSGVEGKRFTVVAQEIRKLAEQSGRATQDIKNLISTVLLATEEAVTRMSESGAEVSRSAEASGKVREALEAILSATEENARKAESISRSVREVQKLAAEMREAERSLDAVTSENVSAIEAVAAAMEEMSRGAGDISRMSQLFADMAQSQQDLIAQFEISESRG